MQLTSEDTDIDRAIAEFTAAVGFEIKAIQVERHARVLAEIARLEARIAKLRKQKKRTVEPLRELCELRTKQVQFELSAA